ncbi:MAG: 2-oxoacid:ferredoxin oxidoreductase subunit beta [Dehalococcoidia bacterium]|nr:2-oxoacid:ferredoxin oxidoreductase subunit beta [Dehalococcoidia bacterium]
MTSKNEEYDFKWCPGCGDFGVRRSLEYAVADWITQTGQSIENTVVVAGIGCSGNMVHLLEGPQPFGIHGIHGRTLPISFGIKMGRPDLNVVIVAGDGDFLSIGMEHIAPQAQRNLNVTAIIMDNAVYGLTKGQSSPTTDMGVVTPTTPYGKVEGALNPLDLYLTLGASFIASGISTKIRPLGNLMSQAMHHPGFAIVHVQSPCTTYNDNYEILKGNPKKGMAPVAWDIPAEHDPTDRAAAHRVIHSGGIPLGVIYKQENSKPLDKRMGEAWAKARTQSVEQLLDSFLFKVS